MGDKFGWYICITIKPVQINLTVDTNYCWPKPGNSWKITAVGSKWVPTWRVAKQSNFTDHEGADQAN